MQTIVSKYRWWRKLYFKHGYSTCRASIDYIISDINGKYFYGVDLAKNVNSTDARIFYSLQTG